MGTCPGVRNASLYKEGVLECDLGHTSMTYGTLNTAELTPVRGTLEKSIT